MVKTDSFNEPALSIPNAFCTRKMDYSDVFSQGRLSHDISSLSHLSDDSSLSVTSLPTSRLSASSFLTFCARLFKCSQHGSVSSKGLLINQPLSTIHHY